MNIEEFTKTINFLYSEKNNEEIILNGEIKTLKKIESINQLSVLSKIIFTNSREYIYSSFLENIFSKTIEAQNYSFHQIGIDQYFKTNAFSLTEDDFKRFKIAEVNKKII